MDAQVAFAEIEEILVARIPERVRELKIPVPVYCLMIEYYSSTVVGDVVPTLRLPSESFRTRVQMEKRAEAPYFLWSPHELPHSPEIISAALDDGLLVTKIRAHPNLVSRKMARNVALRLNELDWSEMTPIADDFVVIAADATQAFADTFGDIKASVGERRLDRLRSCGLIGGKQWSRL